MRTDKEINDFINNLVNIQINYEKSINKQNRDNKGVFLTNSIDIVDDILNIVDIDNILNKKILEPSCGQGIFIIRLIYLVYKKYINKNIVSDFISNSLYFNDIQEDMIIETKNNINLFYNYLYNENYCGEYNSIVFDFTDRCKYDKNHIYHNLYNSFDYVVGNPPYVTLYGRRDKKDSEEQRIRYLNNYDQFPKSVKNGKINIVMLFIEHSLDFLKQDGKLGFIIDIAFFETAYKYTRKLLVEKTSVEEIQHNIKCFSVASGQIILKTSKKIPNNNVVRVIDKATQKCALINQDIWNTPNDEYKFRINGCLKFKNILDKVKTKGDRMLVDQFPPKSLRTCVMLLNMEDKFTSSETSSTHNSLVYPYYQGSKSLSEKYGNLEFSKYFIYNKLLQDIINDELKVILEKQGIKNKKRIGLGETKIYDNPKVFIRQSAKQIIASVDMQKSSANNSLYVFSLRDNSQESINKLYYICGFLNSSFVTYFAQQMNIIRFSQGKQPQIKIGDLGTIFIPEDDKIEKEISLLCKSIYDDRSNKIFLQNKIDDIIFNYYNIDEIEKQHIYKSINTF